LRQHDSAAVTTLDGYRARYALYKGDPNLQAVHARAPWFVIWDDHEVNDNYAGDTPKAGVDEVDFAARRAAAYQAWWEHQPTRLPKPDGDSLVIYRTLRWGSLATVVGLDGRQYRDDQPCDRGGDLSVGCAERDDPKRTMLGAQQEAWVAEQLPSSTSTWSVVANQTIFSPSGIPVGESDVYNLDQWDGYPAARDRMLDVLATTKNPVIVTGDIHASAVGDVRRGDDIVAVELVGPAMSSTFPAQYAALFEAAGEAAGAAMVDAVHNGYVVCELTADRFRADYRFVSTTAEETATVSTASSWQIAAGTPGVKPLA
jgi:alkaline phosphatase D